jgi:hypothetical protein
MHITGIPGNTPETVAELSDSLHIGTFTTRRTLGRKNHVPGPQGQALKRTQP